MARWIAGMDGCRGRWATALLDLDDPSAHAMRLVATPEAVLDGPEAPLAVGIDIPIGLPERVGRGRSADLAARAFLGRHASVFPVPGRAAVYAETYDEAKRLSRETTDPPFAPSIQLWNILPYVRQVDALLRRRPELAARLHEVHPEVAFHRINGDRPLYAAKKGARRAEGLAQRRRLLLAEGLPAALVEGRVAGIPADDHLDALAALVVARDLVAGRAMPLPDPYERDAHGLPVVIWAPGAR